MELVEIKSLNKEVSLKTYNLDTQNYKVQKWTEFEI